MSCDYLKAGDCNLQFRIKIKLKDRIDDIAHFHHLTRADWIRLQLERAVAKEDLFKKLEKRTSVQKVLCYNLCI